MKGLHVGCGARVEKGWVNIDLNPSTAGVQNVDVRRGLPFETASFDFVYSEHFIEHLERREGEYFVLEAARVLRPGGVIRISTPDMESLAQLYLAALRFRTSPQAQATPDPAAFFAPVGWVPQDPAELINGGMRYWEHRHLWDFESMSRSLYLAGFSGVARAKHGHTRYPGVLLEGRPSLRDLIVEGQKPQ